MLTGRVGNIYLNCKLLGPAHGRYPKFILLVFVSYLDERWELCVGNSSHFCTPVLDEHVQ